MRLRISAILLVAAIILAVWNPSEPAFRTWLASRLEVKMSANDYSRIAAVDRTTADWVANTIRDSPVHVERSNFVVCSLFTARVGGAKLRFLGVTGRFVSLDD